MRQHHPLKKCRLSRSERHLHQTVDEEGIIKDEEEVGEDVYKTVIGRVGVTEEEVEVTTKDTTIKVAGTTTKEEAITTKEEGTITETREVDTTIIDLTVAAEVEIDIEQSDIVVEKICFLSNLI